jgi:lipid-A-disaccharide synthase
VKFYLVAGERSGDLHGGNLISALRRIDQNLIFRGFGGEAMQQAGMEVVVHYRELAFMGFAEVLANLKTISKKLGQCKTDILSHNPDVVVLIDYAGFNLRIAQFAKSKGFKVFWYISPKVWAWNQSRAKQLKAVVDRMFVILPFEKDFFKKFNWHVDYVGNPVLDAVKAHRADSQFLQKHNLSPGNIIALLPGSRKQEVSRVIPVMAAVASELPGYQFVVARVDNLGTELYSPLEQLRNVKLITGSTYDLLAHASSAIVTSGTATLETCLFKVPQVVVYKSSAISYQVARMLIRVPFISLVNLVAGKEVVKELIQHHANPREILTELKQLLYDASYRQQMVEGYNLVFEKLNTGSASENAARLMLDYLAK